MKRRDFIVGATGTAGMLLLKPGLAATPCPPILEGSSIACPAGDVEADWLSRISNPGVVWYHDFRSVDEVDAFRWNNSLPGGGNNPDDLPGGRAINTVELDTSDGITGGGCLRVSSPAGTANPQTWWRQFSPLKGSATAADGRGSGKVEDDPGADGTITVRDWSPTSGGDQTEDWHDGFYGHPDYHSETTTLAGPASFDGTEFYLQVRVKNDAKHLTDQPEPGGKIFIFSRAGISNDERQIVVEAYDPEDGQNLYSMNRSGTAALEQDTPGNSNQPGGDIPGLCDFSATGAANCWRWSNGWDTYLFHMRPGTNTRAWSQGQANGDMVLRVWSALAGQTAYTKIWDQDTCSVGFPSTDSKGYNAFMASCYLNNIDLTDQIDHKFDQMIFSHNFIPCPQV